MTDRLHTFARKLRKSSTDAEQLLWSALRNRRLNGLKFRRQHLIGHYIVDFYCSEKQLIIEVDGDYHLFTDEQDAQRQQWLESQGYRLIRFWNEDVLQDLEAVVKNIEIVVEDDIDINR
ncbi:endonuclease domain-containing protein [candidate division KSB1 bacterium]|nr:endonuclease domain-containing protein [candidate division KSB1 bacterium]RQW00859.1 MAG: endonuclease domain-containing protein [candidate division KSB1 bacterium]